MSRGRAFRFEGPVPASKSILNRLLVIRSLGDPAAVRVEGDSDADDVRHLRQGLAALVAGRPIDCGAAGTVLRFLALRAAREPGRHVLTGTPRLMSRPLAPLREVLRALGATATLEPPPPDGAPALVVEAPHGWRWSDPVAVDCRRSSQFASAVLLSSFGLPRPLELALEGPIVSEGYLDLTAALVKRAGLDLDRSPGRIRVPADARVKPGTYRAEIDLSSAFALAAAAAVAGEARITEFPSAPLQPDGVFPEILSAMGVPIRRDADSLTVQRAERLGPVDWNLVSAPDLFPVLAVLAALAEGRSRLHGATQLGHKESHRIERTVELLRALDREAQARPDGAVVDGRGFEIHDRPIVFDPDQDHRLAMAAGVARKAGFRVEITRPEVVTKSYPGFWSAVGESES